MDAPIDPFAAARNHFDALLRRLGAHDAGHMTHTDVEGLVEKEGREALRLAFQGHLDLRGAREREARPLSVTGTDGYERSRLRDSSRQVQVVFGEVTVTRTAYSYPAIPVLFPLEAALNLPPDSYSLTLRSRVAELALGGSYERAVDLLERNVGAKIAKRQAEEITIRSATDFDDFYASRAGNAPKGTQDLLVLTFDGKGVIMRHDALRDATRRAAEKEAHKLSTRLSPGEKSNRKRVAEVASVYSVPRWVRTADDVVAELDGDQPKRPKVHAKRVWASIVKDAKGVIDDVFAEAHRRDPKHERRWVVLVDGNETQIRQAKAAAARYGVRITLVLDLIHVTEYLWKAAWCFHDKGDEAAETWVRERLHVILCGRSSDVGAGIRRSATLRGLDDDARKGVDACCDYLQGHRAMMRYDLHLADGLPIATGVIEGACRHLVQDRMDITGARWGLEGAEAVLRLRSLYASGDLDEYWAWHHRAEFQRNHLQNYADGTLDDHPLRRAA
jgi:hypothetical protein